jgi:hypothetical protein
MQFLTASITGQRYTFHLLLISSCERHTDETGITPPYHSAEPDQPELPAPLHFRTSQVFRELRAGISSQNELVTPVGVTLTGTPPGKNRAVSNPTANGFPSLWFLPGLKTAEDSTRFRMGMKHRTLKFGLASKVSPLSLLLFLRSGRSFRQSVPFIASRRFGSRLADKRAKGGLANRPDWSSQWPTREATSGTFTPRSSPNGE